MRCVATRGPRAHMYAASGQGFISVAEARQRDWMACPRGGRQEASWPSHPWFSTPHERRGFGPGLLIRTPRGRPGRLGTPSVSSAASRYADFTVLWVSHRPKNRDGGGGREGPQKRPPGRRSISTISDPQEAFQVNDRSAAQGRGGVKLVPRLADVGPEQPMPHQIWASPGQQGPNSAGLEATLAKCSPNFSPCLADSGPCLVEAGPHRAFGRILPKDGQFHVKLRRALPNSGHVWPNVGKFGRSCVEVGPILAKLRPNLNPNRSHSARRWLSSGNIDWLGPNQTNTWPVDLISPEIGPESAKSGRCR